MRQLFQELFIRNSDKLPEGKRRYVRTWSISRKHFPHPRIPILPTTRPPHVQKYFTWSSTFHRPSRAGAELRLGSCNELLSNKLKMAPMAKPRRKVVTVRRQDTTSTRLPMTPLPPAACARTRRAVWWRGSDGCKATHTGAASSDTSRGHR